MWGGLGASDGSSGTRVPGRTPILFTYLEFGKETRISHHPAPPEENQDPLRLEGRNSSWVSPQGLLRAKQPGGPLSLNWDRLKAALFSCFFQMNQSFSFQLLYSTKQTKPLRSSFFLLNRSAGGGDPSSAWRTSLLLDENHGL